MSSIVPVGRVETRSIAETVVKGSPRTSKQVSEASKASGTMAGFSVTKGCLWSNKSPASVCLWGRKSSLDIKTYCRPQLALGKLHRYRFHCQSMRLSSTGSKIGAIAGLALVLMLLSLYCFLPINFGRFRKTPERKAEMSHLCLSARWLEAVEWHFQRTALKYKGRIPAQAPCLDSSSVSGSVR